ncbi:MAG: addiction module antitoxin [Sphingomonas sp.]
MALNVRVSGALSDFVAANVGDDGLYDNASEYVRDLIRRDLARVELERFEALKAELQHAFSQPESTAEPIDADAFITRMRQRRR